MLLAHALCGGPIDQWAILTGEKTGRDFQKMATALVVSVLRQTGS